MNVPELDREQPFNIEIEGATYDDLTTLIEYCRAMQLNFYVSKPFGEVDPSYCEESDVPFRVSMTTDELDELKAILSRRENHDDEDSTKGPPND